MRKILFIISILIFNISIYTFVVCCHNNEIMQNTIDNMAIQQQKQAAEIRQIKTDTETALRIVITGDYMEVEK